MLIKEFQLGLGLVVEVVMLQRLFGQQTSSMVAWPLKRNSKNGLVRSVQMSHSFSPMELPIAQVEVRYVFFTQTNNYIKLCEK